MNDRMISADLYHNPAAYNKSHEDREHLFTTITTCIHSGAPSCTSPGDSVHRVAFVNGLCDHNVTNASGSVQLGSLGSLLLQGIHNY